MDPLPATAAMTARFNMLNQRFATFTGAGKHLRWVKDPDLKPLRIKDVFGKKEGKL